MERVIFIISKGLNIKMSLLLYCMIYNSCWERWACITYFNDFVIYKFYLETFGWSYIHLRNNPFKMKPLLFVSLYDLILLSNHLTLVLVLIISIHDSLTIDSTNVWNMFFFWNFIWMYLLNTTTIVVVYCIRKNKCFEVLCSSLDGFYYYMKKQSTISH